MVLRDSGNSTRRCSAAHIHYARPTLPSARPLRKVYPDPQPEFHPKAEVYAPQLQGTRQNSARPKEFYSYWHTRTADALYSNLRSYLHASDFPHRANMHRIRAFVLRTLWMQQNKHPRQEKLRTDAHDRFLPHHQEYAPD